MTRILLIPAARTDWHEQHRLVGDMDLPINVDGQRMAEVTARDLEDYGPALVHCGNDGPSRETAQIIGRQLRIKVKPHKTLREIDLGVWEGLTLEDFSERFARVHRQWRADPLSVEPPEGESVATLTKRLIAGLAILIRRKSAADTMGVVLGRFAWAGVACRLMDGQFDAFWRYIDAEPVWRVFETSPEALSAAGATAGASRRPA